MVMQCGSLGKVRTALAVCAAVTLVLGCSRASQFDGGGGTLKHKFGDAAASDSSGGAGDPSSGAESTGDFLLPCSQKKVQSPLFFKGQKTPKVFIPMDCAIAMETQTPPQLNLDIVFVLDVTGSMGSSLLAVKKDLAQFVSQLANKGWKPRVGAVAFEDKVLEDGIIPLQNNVTDVLSQMESKQLWTPALGFGGDAPEVGLAAIERAAKMLTENSQSNSNIPVQNHKLIVYVSDAPAQRAKKGGYSVTETANVLKDLKNKVTSAAASLQLVVATTDSRKGLFDEMPTPRDQIKDLVSQSGLSATLNSVPFVASSFTAIDSLLEKTPRSMIANVSCQLRGVEIKTATGQRLLEEKNVSGNMEKNWVGELGDYAMSKDQMILVERLCEGGQTYQQNISADF